MPVISTQTIARLGGFITAIVASAPTFISVAPVKDELRSERTWPLAPCVMGRLTSGSPQNCLAPSSFWVSNTANAFPPIASSTGWTA
jgi:hypothetical protein